MSSALTITIFIVGMIAAIMLHEWGHFATARRFGMRADKFFLGFGPTLWSTRRGETEYGVKAFPLGGFVRIKGMAPTDERKRSVGLDAMDPDRLAQERRELAAEQGVGVLEVPAVPESAWSHLTTELFERGVPRELRAAITAEARQRVPDGATPALAAAGIDEAAADLLPATRKVGDLTHRVLLGDEGRFFHDRPAWQRTIVLIAGSTMHFIQAVVLLFVGFWLFGQVIALPVIDVVAPNSPAAAAGLEPGDRITAVDGVSTVEFEAIRDAIRDRPGQPTEFSIVRDGVALVEVVTPESVTEVSPTLDVRDIDGRIVVASLAPDGPLGRAGASAGVVIVAIAGEPITSPEQLQALLLANAGSATEVTLEGVVDGAPAQQTVSFTPETFDPAELAGTFGRLGFGPASANARMPVGEAFSETFTGAGSIPVLFRESVFAFGRVFGPEGVGALFGAVTGDTARDPGGAVSLVGAASVAGQGTSAFGPLFLFAILASINVFIGIFNLLPLPPLDGGHVAVLAIERGVNGVRRRRGRAADFTVDPRAVAGVAVPVIVLIGTFSLAIIWLDIVNPIQLP